MLVAQTALVLIDHDKAWQLVAGEAFGLYCHMLIQLGADELGQLGRLGLALGIEDILSRLVSQDVLVDRPDRCAGRWLGRSSAPDS